MGLQNSDHFARIDDVKYFYDIGQRCSPLTYNSQNRIGFGLTERVDGGVSDYGAAIIAAMNAVGMLVDISHCGDKTTVDAIDISSKPIAITHGNRRAIVDHPRVKTDAAILTMTKKGCVMGITTVRMVVSETEPTGIGNVFDHIDHVGIGSDTDLNGYDDMTTAANTALRAGYKESYAFRDEIDGFDHPRKIYDLTE